MWRSCLSFLFIRKKSKKIFIFISINKIVKLLLCKFERQISLACRDSLRIFFQYYFRLKNFLLRLFLFYFFSLSLICCLLCCYYFFITDILIATIILANLLQLLLLLWPNEYFFYIHFFNFKFCYMVYFIVFSLPKYLG